MRKWIALFLAVIMALSLCACGKDAGGKKDNETENNTVTAFLFTEVIMTEKDSDGDTDTMKGVVEYDENYNIIGTKTYINDKLNYEVTYDKDINKPLLEKSYYEDGSRTSTVVYVYDENGNRLERTSTFDDGEEKRVNKVVCTYDANGNMLTQKDYDDGKLNYEYTFTYTASGKLESEIHNWNGEESWTRYTYDEHDNILTEKQGFGEEVTTSKTYENTYENGKLTEVKIYRGETLDERICYDADGNETLQIGYSNGEENYRSESTYENGKLVKNVVSYDGEQQSIALYTYDAKGNLTERSYTYGDDEPQRRVYTYDDNGNAIGLKTYEGNELEGEYILTYKTVTVSKEIAKRIEQLNTLLVDF